MSNHAETLRKMAAGFGPIDAAACLTGAASLERERICPIETCPVGEDVLFICLGERDADQDVWINNGHFVMPEFVVDGWRPLPPKPEEV